MTQESGARHSPLHGLIPLADKRIQDVHPGYAHIKKFVYLGTPCPECPSCRRPFTAARRPRRRITLFATDSLIPIGLSYRICGQCAAAYRLGGERRDAVLASIQHYIDGEACE